MSSTGWRIVDGSNPGTEIAMSDFVTRFVLMCLAHLPCSPSMNPWSESTATIVFFERRVDCSSVLSTRPISWSTYDKHAK